MIIFCRCSSMRTPMFLSTLLMKQLIFAFMFIITKMPPKTRYSEIFYKKYYITVLMFKSIDFLRICFESYLKPSMFKSICFYLSYIFQKYRHFKSSLKHIHAKKRRFSIILCKWSVYIEKLVTLFCDFFYQYY